jgi:hypothetical protein
MDADEFHKRAELNQELADYIDEVALAANPHEVDRTMGFEPVCFLVAYALFRMAKNYFDYERGLNEADLRQTIIDQVDGLVQMGWDRDEAIEAVERISKDVATLRPESPILKAALDILTKGASSPESN